MRFFIRTFLLAAICLPLSVMSQEGNKDVRIYQDKPRSYVGGNLAHATVPFDGLEDDATLTAALVRLGGMASDYIGVEARFGFGGDTYTYRENIGGLYKLDTSINHIGGVYFTARAPFWELPYDLGEMYAQGYLGVANSQLEINATTCTGSVCNEDTEREDETGASFGAALGVRVLPQVSLALEYMQYLDKDDVELSTVEAGIMYHF
jgi:outer membrane immunogenic protein